MNPSDAQPPTPSPIAETAPTPSAPVATDYTSNPFLVIVKGLVSILQTNPVSSLLAAVVLFGSLLLVFLVGGIFSGIGGVGKVLGTGLIFVAYILILPLLQGTYLAIAAASHENKEISTKQAINNGMKKLLPLILYYILYVLMITVGFIFLIIPGFIILARGSLGPVIIYDENVGVMTAFKRSFALTKSHVFEMLGVLFAGVFFGNSGLLIPSLSVAPIVGRYNDLKKLKDSGAAKPKTHWLNYVAVIVSAILLTGFIAAEAVLFHNLSDSAKDSTTTTDDFNNYFKDLNNSTPTYNN